MRLHISLALFARENRGLTNPSLYEFKIKIRIRARICQRILRYGHISRQGEKMNVLNMKDKVNYRKDPGDNHSLCQTFDRFHTRNNESELFHIFFNLTYDFILALRSDSITTNKNYPR